MIYKPEFVEQARSMCRLGATDEELAEHFEVCVRTIYRWRNTHEAFAEAVVVGKEHADARVERALYSRAVGCSVERTKVFKSASDPKPVYATYKHHLPPDPNAALHWLRVRQPRKWQIREEVKSDPNAKEMIEKALARAEAYTSTLVPFRQPPPEAAQLEPSPEPEPAQEAKPPPEPAPRPAPPPDPFPPPAPPPVHGERRQGHCPLLYPKPPG
jgi:hypothetical protein